jgi:hypothetical protein
MITRYDSRVASSRQKSNAMIETDREGKTPVSILCGLVYAPGCALLVTFHVYDAKKIPVDALGTLGTTGILSLYVLNAAKDWVRPDPRLKSKGIEFEVGNKYMLRQLTGLLIHQNCHAC